MSSFEDFSLQKHGRVRILVYYSCMLAPNDREQFQAVFSNLLAPAKIQYRNRKLERVLHRPISFTELNQKTLIKIYFCCLQ